MRVDPEGPEGVVEVEDDEFGEGRAVGKGGRRAWVLVENGNAVAEG